MLLTWVTKAARTCADEPALLFFSKSASLERLRAWNCDDRYVLECPWPENQEFQSKKLIERTVKHTGVTDCALFWRVCQTLPGVLGSEEGVSLIGVNAFVRKAIHIVDLINPSEKCLGAAWLFHCTMPIPRGPGCHMVPYESVHCDDNFTGQPDPAFCCGIALCVFSVLFVSKTEWERYKVWWESGCLGQDPSVPALCPTEPSARAGPGRAKSSRTRSADTPGLGWRNAGCSN